MGKVATKWRIISWLLKAPLGIGNREVPTACSILQHPTQTLLLCYSIITTFLTLRRSNRTKSLWKTCSALDVTELCPWIAAIPTTVSSQASSFINSKESAFITVDGFYITTSNYK